MLASYTKKRSNVWKVGYSILTLGGLFGHHWKVWTFLACKEEGLWKRWQIGSYQWATIHPTMLLPMVSCTKQGLSKIIPTSQAGQRPCTTLGSAAATTSKLSINPHPGIPNTTLVMAIPTTQALSCISATLRAILRVEAFSFPTTGLRLINRRRRSSSQVTTLKEMQCCTDHQVNNVS